MAKKSTRTKRGNQIVCSLCWNLHLMVSVIFQVTMRRTTLSAIDTATNKLIDFSVAHVKVCKYLNETTHYVNFCDFCILCAQSQCHNIKTILKPSRICGIYTGTCMFWQKVFAASILPFLERNCAFNWKTKFYVFIFYIFCS